MAAQETLVPAQEALAADTANIPIENTPADAGDRPDVGADRDPPPRLPILVDGEPVEIDVETEVNPAALTLEQREIEALEAEDNRWRAAIDGQAAFALPASAPAEALTLANSAHPASSLTGDGPIG